MIAIRLEEKFMIRPIVATSAALILASCNFSAGKSETREVGAATTRQYQVANFSKIEVAGPYDVTVATGKDVAVAASGGVELLDETEVTVKGDTLIIKPKKSRGIRWSWKGGKASFTVSTQALTGAAIAGSGDIVVDKASGDFEGEVAGSGSLDVRQMTAGKASLEIAGSGNIRAAGTADSTDAGIAGSGNIDASKLVARTATVSIAGSGGVLLQATEAADVSIAGSGNVDIAGGAKCTIDKAGSGNVTCD
jgi:hypothetical protein